MKINFKKFIVKIEKVGVIEKKESFWPEFIVGLVLIFLLSFGPQLIQFVEAIGDTEGVTFSATVGPSLTLTVDVGSKAFGTISAGTPKFATSTLTIATNNALGFFTQINRASTTNTLFSGANTIPDIPNSNNWTAPAATSTAGASAAWTNGVTVGLGFRVASGATYTTCGAATAWWGTLDNGSASTLYSGISTSTAPATIANCNFYNAGNITQTVVYKIDVSGSQPAADYVSSPITFTATTQ